MSKEIAKDLTQGPVLKQLARFSLPVAAANALQAVYSMVDMIVVGQFMGAGGLSAVGIGGQLMMMFMSIGMGFSFGAQVLISQQVGAKDDNLQPTIGTLFSLEMLLAVIFGVLGIVLAPWMLGVMNTPGEAWEQAMGYTVICCAGMLFIYGYNAVCGILRGMGESKLPMIFVAVASVINLVLDYVFVAWFHMGAAGAALATVLAQGISFVASLVYLVRNKERFGFDFKLKSFRISVRHLIPMSKLGIPYVIQSLMITCSMMYVNAQVNSFGVAASAVDSIGSKLNSIVNIVIGAVSVSGATMVGQCFGARSFQRIRKCHNACMAVCMASFAVIAAAYLLFDEQIFSIFSTDPEVVSMAPSYMRIAVLWVLSIATMTPPYCIMDGVGNAELGLVVCILDGVVGRIGLCLLLGGTMGLEGYWLGNALAGFITTIIAGWYYLSGRWEKRELLLKNE